MAAADLLFTEVEMAVDQGLGYPKAYAKLCRDRSLSPYSHGPPFTFTPYALQQQEALRVAELEEMFPIIDPKAKPTAKPKIFVSLLWKQLNHLGNAGFDPAIFRVDPYGNVLYYHADSASPLAWDIDHWFPCARGGLTVPSNLRILQWQVCKKKHNELEFLTPWWDLQLGISINQFLSVFASSNSDFRHRAFSLLFSEGESEELNAAQTVDSHNFPQHFIEAKEKLGLAPAAIVVSRRESYDFSSALKSLDVNRRPRSNSPIVAARKLRTITSKENENPDMVSNPYQAIVAARDSLRHREETAKMQAEIQKLDDEVNELKQKAEDEKVTVRELELVLIKRRRRAEKCRRLAEAQSSYRVMLEKMIRDAMHQNVIYKEQVRLNQAASNALMARLEAQKAICDCSEKELYRKFTHRDELEKQLRPEGEHARKRSRMDNSLLDEEDHGSSLCLPANELEPETNTAHALPEKEEDKTVLYLPGIKSTPFHKELRVYLEEEQKASEAGASSLNEDRKQEEVEEDGNPIWDNLQRLKIEERLEMQDIRLPVPREPKGEEEDDESRRLRGQENVEKWLQMLLENTVNAEEKETSRTDEIIRKLNLKYPQHQDLEHQKKDGAKREEETNHIEEGRGITAATPIKNPPYRLQTEREGEESRSNFQGQGRERKEKGLARSESARAFRRIPSSPSLILGMKKGVDCIRKKPSVTGDEEEELAAGNNFIKSSIKTIKKAVKI